MTGDQMRQLRESFGETQAAFGVRLGYEGEPASVARKVRRYELGEQTIEGPLRVLLILLERGVGKADTRRRSKSTL